MDPITWLWLAIAAGVLAVIYGIFSMMFYSPPARG